MPAAPASSPRPLGIGESEPESWYRLSVFDDGWVELPGGARQASRSRGDLLRALTILGVVAIVLGVAMLLPRLGLDDQRLLIVSVVFGISVLALLVVLAVTQLKRVLQRFSDLQADHRQLVRERAQKRVLRRRPGAPLFRRAMSAEELASWFENVHLVRATDVVDVSLASVEPDHYAVVRLSDGATRTYRSPDAALERLLGGFSAGRAAHLP